MTAAVREPRGQDSLVARMQSGAAARPAAGLSDLLEQQAERALMFRGRCELCGQLCRSDRRRCYAHPLGQF